MSDADHVNQRDADVRAALREYREVDDYRRWVTGDDLHRTYHRWALENDRPTQAVAVFGRTLRRVFPHLRRVNRRVDGVLTRGYAYLDGPLARTVTYGTVPRECLP